jgi:glutathione S-transferase
MKLFLKPGSCSLAPHIVLEEAGLSYETEGVDLKTKITESGKDYWQINPKGYVPALQLESGEVITEGPAISQFIADQVPLKRLAPANGTIERVRMQSWLTFVGTELHKSHGAFFNAAAKDDWKTVARGNLERRYGYLDAHLSDKPYLLGEEFTAADAYLFTVLRWIGVTGLTLATWPHLSAFQERVAARPAVAAAMKAEGLTA